MAPFNAGNAPSYQDLSVKKPIHRASRRVRPATGTREIYETPPSALRPRGYPISGALGPAAAWVSRKAKPAQLANRLTKPSPVRLVKTRVRKALDAIAPHSGDGELLTFFSPQVITVYLIGVIRLLSQECGSEPRSVHASHDCLGIKLRLRVQLP